jgi:hypothetical protein
VLERLVRVDVVRARLQAEQRRNGLQVVLDAMVDLLGEDAAHDSAPVLERNGGVMRDRLEQGAFVVRERRVAVGDELADHATLPAERRAHVVRAGASLGPRDAAVLEHERRTGRLHRVHRRLHDRLERLLEVQRLGDGLGDLRERLQLRDAALRLRVEVRVQDRLRHLAGDRRQQLDLAVGVDPRLTRADVERALEPLALDEDRHGEDRLVLRLLQVGELLEARVEVRLRRDHHGCALERGRAGDALTRPHARAERQLLDVGAVGRTEDELTAPLVVEVDEAGVGAERVRDLRRDEVEHLLEIERRVDGRARLGEEPQVPFGRFHARMVARGVNQD